MRALRLLLLLLAWDTASGMARIVLNPHGSPSLAPSAPAPIVGQRASRLPLSSPEEDDADRLEGGLITGTGPRFNDDEAMLMHLTILGADGENLLDPYNVRGASDAFSDFVQPQQQTFADLDDLGVVR